MNNFAFSKINYILLAVGFAIILIGFALMAGDSTTEQAFNPDIFSDTRIKIAPMVCLFGFIFEIVAILWPSKRVVEDATPKAEVLNSSNTSSSSSVLSQTENKGNTSSEETSTSVL